MRIFKIGDGTIIDLDKIFIVSEVILYSTPEYEEAFFKVNDFTIYKRVYGSTVPGKLRMQSVNLDELECVFKWRDDLVDAWGKV